MCVFVSVCVLTFCEQVARAVLLLNTMATQRVLSQSKETLLQNYNKRLKDDISSILDNFTEIIKTAKVPRHSTVSKALSVTCCVCIVLLVILSSCKKPPCPSVSCCTVLHLELHTGLILFSSSRSRMRRRLLEPLKPSRTTMKCTSEQPT